PRLRTAAVRPVRPGPGAADAGAARGERLGGAGRPAPPVRPGRPRPLRRPDRRGRLVLRPARRGLRPAGPPHLTSGTAGAAWRRRPAGRARPPRPARPTAAPPTSPAGWPAAPDRRDRARGGAVPPASPPAGPAGVRAVPPGAAPPPRHLPHPTRTAEVMPMTTTLADLTARTGLDVLDHPEQQVSVPVIDGLQAQGDLIVVPAGLVPGFSPPVDRSSWEEVPAAGLEL